MPDCLPLDRNLRSDFNHPSCRNLKIVGGVVRKAGQADKQAILPARHSRMTCRLERPAREKKRRRHDVELPAELAGNGQSPRHVRRLREAKAQHDALESLADRLDADPLRGIDPRGIGGFDRQDDVVLMQHLEVLQAVEERGRGRGRIASEEDRRAR